jgi:transposase-like protein
MIDATNWSAVGCKYGVSDTAVRKWVRFYERQQERQRRERAREAGGGDKAA